MKVLFCSANFPPSPGGISRFSEGIVHSLKKKKIDLCVLSDGFDIRKKSKKAYVCYYFNVNIVFIQVLLRTIHVLFATIKFNPDIIFISTWKEYGFGALLANWFLKKDFFVQVHGTEIMKYSKGSLHFLLSKIIFHFSKCIIPNSSYTSSLLNKYKVDSSKVEVFHPGVQTIRHSGQKKNFKEFLFFSACRLIYRKGIDLSIEALEHLKDKEWKYYIAGDGESIDFLINLVNKKGLSEKIKFLGHISDELLNYYYSVCDIFLLPGRYCENDIEGFGIVYLEANLFGKPVIGSRIGGVEDAIIDGVTGLLTENENIDDILEKITILYNDKILRAKLGYQGKIRTEKYYLWENHISNLIEIFKKYFES
jgi:phosphatidylinositol alpha-1,6-mannosyltransferase